MSAYDYDDLDDRPARGGAEGGERPALRPPVGLPEGRGREERGRLGIVVSVLVHVVIILLLLVPLFRPDVMDIVLTRGAGGAGPAGGGGGGRRGTGGEYIQERLHYMQVAPPAAQAPATPSVQAAPQPTPTPPVPMPRPVERPRPTPPPPAQQAAPAPPAGAATQGQGGGTGDDGSSGSGPGSGGGIGSGVGTGIGSGVGPGTGGGGADSVYRPTPVQIFMPPYPVPDAIKNSHVVAVFDIDSTGKILDVSFNPTRDGGYNRKLRETLRSMRFRPAVRRDGRPVRAQYPLDIYF